MRMLTSLFLFVLAACSSGKEKKFTASTPAGPAVRTFLGIPAGDSIDFIRWNLRLQDNDYSLSCHYGISKSNTNGFMNDGKKVIFSGNWKKEGNYLHLLHNDHTLKIAAVNSSLLHFVNDDNSMMVGNGGWSYALNNEDRLISDEVSTISSSTSLPDSMAFEGRTPCKWLYSPDTRPDCYKLKWYIVFYTDPLNHQPSICRINGTAYRSETGRARNWTLISGKDGRMVYHIKDTGNKSLQLVQLDKNILAFTDSSGKLLVGDHDFSYTLNRRW